MAWYDVFWDGKKVGDPRVADWIFMGSGLHPVWMLIVYFTVIYWLMMRWMRARDNVPIENINIYIQLYNATSAVMNLVLAAAFIDLMRRAHYSLRCQPVRTTGELELKMASCVYMFFLYKIIELVDTALFIGGDNARRAHCQHVYHHASILVVAWLGVKFVPGGSTAVFATLSCTSHVVLALSFRITRAYDFVARRNWFYGLLVGLVMKHGLIVFQSGSVIWLGCGYPTWAAFFMIAYCLGFIVMLIVQISEQINSNR